MNAARAQSNDNMLMRFRRHVMEAWAVYTGLHSELFEALQCAHTLEQLAARTNYEPSALRALLTALDACGHIVCDAEGRYALSQASRPYLLRDAPQYIGHAMAFLRTARHYEQYPRLLREGGSVGLDDEQWSYVTRGSAMYAPPAMAALFEHFPELARTRHHFLDVGCGQGAYLLELLRRSPDSEILGIDPNPRVLADARSNLQRAAAPARVRVEQCELARLDGSFDVIMINQVFHVLGEAGSRELLAQALPRLKPGGLLLVQEIVTVPDDPSPALFGFNMRMLFDQGVIFSSAELQALVADAGYCELGAIEVTGPIPGLVWVKARAQRNDGDLHA